MIGLIAWGRNKEADGSRSANPKGLWKIIEQNAAAISRSFDFVQAPPDSLADGGSGPGCDGYEVFEYRQKNYTRYETVSGKGKEELMAASAALAAHGVRFAGDMSFHQMGGENGGPGLFKYNGRRGETKPGWFQNYGQPGETTPPFAPKDDIPSADGAYPFGRVRSYQRSIPAGAVIADAKDVLNDAVRGVGYRIIRWDDTKATNAAAVREIMDSQPGVAFYGEYFDGNPSNLQWWATSWPMQSRSGAEDFTLHWRLQAACNGFNAALFDQGGWGWGQMNPGLAFGFLDNPDTDTADGQQIIFNKGIGYALLLNLPLHASLVYGKDYYGPDVIPGGYGLKPLIDNLCWISRTFAFGNFERRWVDKDVYAFTRDGNGGSLGWSGGLLVAANFNVLNARTITVQTMWAEGTHVHDYTGHAGDAWVGPNGQLTITIPSNAWSGGRSYVCYAPAGVSQAFPMPSWTITQTYFGANDLFIKDATATPEVLAQHIYCAKGTQVHLKSHVRLAAGETFTALVKDANGNVISHDEVGASVLSRAGTTLVEGWHTVTVYTSGAVVPFEVDVTYQYPRKG